ncbi:MAG: hypothetical protein K6E18_05740 [Lachnospiraceae bacterium]|nr:hypothetical protein [Lachnospiraceae bacterium]
MKKRTLPALLLTLGLGISLLGGCGNQKVTPEDIKDTEVTEDDLEADLAEEGDIVIGEDSVGDASDGEEEEDEEDEDTEDEEYVPDPSLHTDSKVFDEKNNVTFNFEAQKTDVAELPETAEMKEKAGDLDNARWEALKIYYEGDETDAKEELEELRQADAISADLLKKIEPYYPKLAPYLAQAKITNYDMTKPYYVDEEEIDFDMYTDNFTTFYLTIYLNEDGSISEFELLEESEYTEEADEEDGDDGEVLEFDDFDDGEVIEIGGDEDEDEEE